MRIKQTLLNIIIALTLILSGSMTASAPTYAAAAQGGGGAAASACPDSATSKGQVLQGLGVTGSDCSDSQVNQTIKTIVTILSVVIGIASVIVIMVSGFKYIVSAGEQNKVANAKSSLIYALVGLAVAALAQLMIHFVLRNTNAT